MNRERERCKKAGLGVGRAGSQSSAGPREGNVNIILKVIGQQAFSIKGHTVNNSDLAGHKLALSQLLNSSALLLLAEAVFE